MKTYFFEIDVPFKDGYIDRGNTLLAISGRTKKEAISEIQNYALDTQEKRRCPGIGGQDLFHFSFFAQDRKIKCKLKLPDEILAKYKRFVEHRIMIESGQEASKKGLYKKLWEEMASYPINKYKTKMKELENLSGEEDGIILICEDPSCWKTFEVGDDGDYYNNTENYKSCPCCGAQLKKH